jgi:TonB family protein
MHRCVTVLICAISSLAVSSTASTTSPAQDASRLEGPQSGVILSKLSPPVYPPLARQTRIAGDVDLTLSVRPDGSVESAVVISGHPLLQQAALESARQSKFECPKCGEGTTSYRLIYTFQLAGSADCCKADEASSDKNGPTQLFPHVTQVQNHVTVIDQPTCICDPAIDRTKVRSLRCLYLWRCGLR